VGDESSGSLRRALALLDGLASDPAAADDGWGVNRLAGHLGRDASQVSRTLRVLADAGFVERDPETLRYRIGWHVFALAARATDGRLVAAAAPVLRRLAATDVGERIHLTVRVGTDVLTVLTEAAPHSIQSVAWVGRLVPAWDTSSGRALLFDHDRAELDRLFAGTPFHDGGPNAPHDVAELHDRIVAARPAGYAIVDEEFEPGLVGASAPIRDFRGSIVAALNVSGPAFRLRDRLIEAGETVLRAATELSTQLGWAPGSSARSAARGDARRPGRAGGAGVPIRRGASTPRDVSRPTSGAIL
jgi:IclR family KDG regulon transcriptional repressor